MSTRFVTRDAVVREVSGGCAAIEVDAPCNGCSQAGCGNRRATGQVRLTDTGLRPGEHVRLSLAIRSLNLASLAAFGPPLAWLMFCGLMLTIYPDSWPTSHSLGPVLFVCGMVVALASGRCLGRWIGLTVVPAISNQRFENSSMKVAV